MMQNKSTVMPVGQNSPPELKVNLHIVEACNMHCEFCFAKFQCKKALSLEDWKHIVDNIVGDCHEGGAQ